MQILTDMISRVMLLDERILLNQVLNNPETQAWIIKMNQDQLFEHGINSNGVLLEDIGGQYSIHTILGVPGSYPGKVELGLPTQWITLYNHGEFYHSFKVELKIGSLEITADPMKDGVSLFKRWGKEVLGLTDENLDKLIEFVKNAIIPQVLDYILKSA